MGKYALVDDEDYERAKQYKWHCCKGGNIYYAARNMRILMYIQKKQYLHHFVMQPEKGYIIDHIDGDGLNNTRANLRQATASQNRQNRGKQGNNTSGFKGVSWDNSRNKWQVHISVKGKSTYIGRYETKEMAAIAYDEAARKYHNEFAKTNFEPSAPSQ
jgi:hypothetical protein